MSTLRTSNLIHGSSSVSNVVLDTSGRALFGPDGPNGRAALYVNPQTNRVGVNTESPAVALDVDGAINTTGNVTVGGTLNLTGDLTSNVINAGSGTAAAPSVSVGTTDNGLYSPGTDQVAISTNGTQRLTIDSSGQIKIEQTSTDRILRIISTGANAANMLFQTSSSGTGDGDGLYVGIDDTPTAYFWNFENTSSVFATNNTERMRIDSSGNVGIGTTNPGRTLDVNGVIRSDGTSGALAFGGNSSTPSEGSAIHRPANNTIAFATDSTERVRIYSDGGVSIKKYLEFRDGGDTTFAGYLGSGNHIITGALNTDFGLRAETNLFFAAGGNAERMRIDSSGAIVLPDGSPGIQFGSVSSPATSTNLDDYEEGTWTPTAVGASTAGTTTYSIQSATYVKIGRLVHVRAYVAWSAATGTGGLYVRGLPYTIGSSVSYGGPAINYWHNITQAGAGVNAIWGVGNDFVYFYNTGNPTASAVSIVTAGSVILCGAYYI